MASVRAVKKAVTIAPTVRTLSSGVPVAPLLNLAARDLSAEHGHGSAARSDAPARFASGVSRNTPIGLVSKTFANGMYRIVVEFGTEEVTIFAV